MCSGKPLKAHRIIAALVLVLVPLATMILEQERASASVTLCRANAALSEETLNNGSDYVYEFAYDGPMASGTFDVNRSDNSSPGLVTEVSEVPSTDAYIGVYNASGSRQTDVAGWAEYLYTC